MVVRASRFCLYLQANDSRAAVVFHSTASDDDHVRDHLFGGRQDSDRRITAKFVLSCRNDPLEFFRGLPDEHLDNVHQQRESLWQGLLSTVGRTAIDCDI